MSNLPGDHPGLLSLIASHDGAEACVCELTDTFDLSAPTISHRLNVLRESGLATSQRRGTWIYYRTNPETITGLSTNLEPRNPRPHLTTRRAEEVCDDP